MERLGAEGSLCVRGKGMAGTFHGPLYAALSVSYRSLSSRAISSHLSRSLLGSAFHALDTILATSVVLIYEKRLFVNH